MAVVAAVCLCAGQGRRWRRTSCILAGLGLFLGVHGFLLGLGFIGGLGMGPVWQNHNGGSRKTDGESETGQE